MTKKDMEQDRPAAPLVARLPQPPDVGTRMALVESLRGHTTSPRWLPERLFPELDALRDEQLRMISQLTAEVDALESLEARFKKEDAEHAEALRQAHRDGSPASAEDCRTSSDDRTSERAAIEERLWAGVAVFAEIADAVITLVREREDQWLADLREGLAPVHGKRQEAERLLAEAKAEEWQVHRLGQWLQTTADDEAFGRQPAPTVLPVPERLVLPPATLERPWHQAGKWATKPKEVAA